MARKRAVGSNQYRTRAGAGLDAVAGPDLLPLVGKPSRMRCGEVWGTGCRAWVQAPDWRHGLHGNARSDWHAAARRPGAPPDLLRQLADDHDEVLQMAVAKNPSCPPDLLQHQANSDNDRLRAAVAANPQCSPHLLDQLAGADGPENRHVRREVARNSNCPPHVLARLVRDPDLAVQRLVAKHPNTPVQIIVRIAVQEEGHIMPRYAALKRPECPVDILIKMLGHPKPWVRQAVAENPNLPQEYRALISIADIDWRPRSI